MWDVVYLPEAESERLVLPQVERNALIHAVEKLAAFGPQLGYPHTSAVQGFTGLRELRPRAGRSPWRALYRESGTIWGSYAAAAWRSGVLVNAGCHRWKSSASWSLRTRTRTCNRRCAPRGVQRICCFLTMRLLTSWLTADSTNEVEMVSPAR